MQRDTTQITFVFFFNFESLSGLVSLLSVFNYFSYETKGGRKLFDEHNYLTHKLHIVVNLGLYFSDLKVDPLQIVLSYFESRHYEWSAQILPDLNVLAV